MASKQKGARLSEGEFQRLMERELERPIDAWKPYVPKPLPFGIQERMDAYRAYPSLTVRTGYQVREVDVS